MTVTIPVHILAELARLSYRARKAKRVYRHLLSDKMRVRGAEELTAAFNQLNEAKKELNKFKSKTIKLW